MDGARHGQQHGAAGAHAGALGYIAPVIGSRETRSMLSDRPHPVLRHAAGVIPVRPGGAILLMLRDDRPDIGSPNRWSTLGGHLEAGETPLQAARREVEEEVR